MPVSINYDKIFENVSEDKMMNLPTVGEPIGGGISVSMITKRQKSSVLHNRLKKEMGLTHGVGIRKSKKRKKRRKTYGKLK